LVYGISWHVKVNGKLPRMAGKGSGQGCNDENCEGSVNVLASHSWVGKND